MRAKSEPTPSPPRTLALKLIIAYKLAKVPLMLALAIWLTVAPDHVYQLAARFAHELSEASALWVRLGRWLEEHLSRRLLRWGAALAWLDSVITGLEATLLLIGKAWGEWLVTIGLALFLIPELLSLERSPSWPRFFVLLVNGAVVVYLSARRWKALRPAKHVTSGP